jgi:hypothetical protein
MGGQAEIGDGGTEYGSRDYQRQALRNCKLSVRSEAVLASLSFISRRRKTATTGGDSIWAVLLCVPKPR